MPSSIVPWGVSDPSAKARQPGCSCGYRGDPDDWLHCLTPRKQSRDDIRMVGAPCQAARFILGRTTETGPNRRISRSEWLAYRGFRDVTAWSKKRSSERVTARRSASAGPAANGQGRQVRHRKAPASRSARSPGSTGPRPTRCEAAASRSMPGWTCMDFRAGRLRARWRHSWPGRPRAATAASSSLPVREGAIRWPRHGACCAGGLEGWLNEPATRPLVLACVPAQKRHGGQGAFYVLLRRSRGGGSRSAESGSRSGPSYRKPREKRHVE